MARRIIVETDLTCEHGVTGRNHLVTTNERKRDGSAVVIECVAGTEVSVLDPGSFECVDNVDEKWLYLVPPEVHDALAGGEQ